MTRVGQAETALIAAPEARFLAFFGACALVVTAAWMWGFTVDDALISVRYAQNLSGAGSYALNAGAPRSDGVTPLPWPFVLALFARSAAPLVVLGRAKILGLVCAALVGARVGAAVAKSAAGRGMKVLGLVALALSLPVAAHVVSGMETCLAIALVTFASTEERAAPRAVVAGVAAAFRPELLPWALTLVVVAAARPSARPSLVRLSWLVAAAGLPFVACALSRVVAFGRPFPLALAAKPSDAAHGLAYVGAAIVVSVGPLAAFAPVAALRAFREGRSVAPCALAAAWVHLGVVVLVGGDWMPYARLVAPVVPGLVYAACVLPSARAVAAARLAVAGAVGAVFLFGAGEKGRGVMRDRAALVALARGELASARTIAALDIGWVSAATDATLVDLAGLTDPEIAVLRGGHTSKAIAPRVLLDRGVDVLLVYTTRDGARIAAGEAVELVGAREVELRLLRSELVARRYRPTRFLPLGAQGAGYVVVQRIAEVPETTP